MLSMIMHFYENLLVTPICHAHLFATCLSGEIDQSALTTSCFPLLSMREGYFLGPRALERQNLWSEESFRGVEEASAGRDAVSVYAVSTGGANPSRPGGVLCGKVRNR